MKWKLKHRLNWEKVHGEIPKGRKIIFLDGNRLNCDVNNLAMVTHAEHVEMQRRNLRSEHPEMTETGVLIAKINVQVEKLKKKGGDK